MRAYSGGEPGPFALAREGHEGMKRTGIKRRPPRRGAMPPEVYAMVMDRNRGRCEAGLEGVCTGMAAEFHHRRSVGVGKTPHTTGNGAALCSACHHHITHVSPARGKELGLVVSRHYSGDPSEKPMRMRTWRGYAWVLLDNEGGYSRCADEM